ncbi:MAG: sigma-54-dependent Fis family transcriptional regulator [Deltaproteobacteria bacterium]|nr:sigma-54-dependent Fis family transcriptional regulator [Deltaproteobacteria bacterium]
MPENLIKNRPRILLIDDGDNYAQMLARTGEFELVSPYEPDSNNGETCCIHDGPAALEFLEKIDGNVDVIVLDMNFNVSKERLFVLKEGSSLKQTMRLQGVAIFREIRKLYPRIPVVFLTSDDDLHIDKNEFDLAETSLAYVLDGYDLDTMRVRISSAISSAKKFLVDENSSVFWGSDSLMNSVRRRLKVLSRGGMPLILEGETGTGKSFLAKQYVHELSGRKGPFVVLDLSSVPEQLMSAHLFGAEKGSYTGADIGRKGVFELAEGGTLFIDEIQNAPIDVQKQLLVVLQDKKVIPLGSSREISVDVKVVAASNISLSEAVAKSEFRSDLYMRLSPAATVKIPPLRERAGELKQLIEQFAQKAFNERDLIRIKDDVLNSFNLKKNTDAMLLIGRPDSKQHNDSFEIVIPPAGWKLLSTHSWPGNMRELEMVVYNIILFTMVEALEALKDNTQISSGRLQVDSTLISELLNSSKGLESVKESLVNNSDGLFIEIKSNDTLNEVAKDVERQYFLHLYSQTGHDFIKMAEILLNDETKGRAVRLRFNQLGLKVREIKN